MGALDARLRGLLVCPRCRGALTAREDRLICLAEGIGWPIVDGIPYLHPEAASAAPYPRSTTG